MYLTTSVCVCVDAYMRAPQPRIIYVIFLVDIPRALARIVDVVVVVIIVVVAAVAAVLPPHDWMRTMCATTHSA